MMQLKFTSSISSIGTEEWNDVCNTEYPFIQHEFLSALEQSGAVCTNNGWTPRHLLIYNNNQLIGLIPGYLKDHSYGEFVFDFQWADAYHRNNIPYYPKYISAIPFSPVTGPRLCIRAGNDVRQITETVIQAVRELLSNENISSWHILFPEKHEAELFAAQGLLTRKAVHFQWVNNHYQDFDDFLKTFSSRKRKNLRKERQKVIDQNITLEYIEGKNITDALWDNFYHFYQLTYLKRSGHSGYLDKSFFQLLGKNMPDHLLMVVARKNNNIIAAALNLKDATALYGRYWGCYEEYDFLHFETCYYQGIEYCINNKLLRFDPGVQGEHKIQRGFSPVYTYSCHWIADGNLREAIAQFLSREEKHLAIYKQQAEKLLPFRAESH